MCGHIIVPSQKLNMLVVDDDPFVRAMLEDILELGGHSVRTAKNGQEGIEYYFDNSDIDLIISDMNMPNMNGIEFTKYIRKRDRDIPIIILTVNKEINIALKAIREGANDYILKDENVSDTILFSIQKVMERHLLEKQNVLLMKELERKNKELERLCVLDALTGIFNRRYFDDSFIQEWKRAAREQIPLSLILADIDYFKNFNDTYGHLKGDDCLRQVAGALKNALRRPGDMLCRYGGEEFAAILSNTNEQGAVTVAEQMRFNVAALAIPHSSSEISDHVTVSMGAGSIVPEPNSECWDFVSEVDRALYLAKKEGRNRVKRMHRI